jgi:ABC-type transport system involved in cytochrome bd biosynthesis fused ATPase/permease subunit
MNWSKFYYDFAAAYGTCWLVTMLIAVVTQSYIKTGNLGVIGFPIIGVIYALICKGSAQQTQDELKRLNERIVRLEQNRRNYEP